MKVISEWWETIKDHEGVVQVLGRDPAGNVSKGYLVYDSTEQLTNAFLQDFVMISLFYNGSEEEGRKNFQKFYDLSE
jgi:hypothetical protein